MITILICLSALMILSYLLYAYMLWCFTRQIKANNVIVGHAIAIIEQYTKVVEKFVEVNQSEKKN
jgi:hypothetical protein